MIMQKMRESVKVIRVSDAMDYYSTHLRFLNFVVNEDERLSSGEIDFIATSFVLGVIDNGLNLNGFKTAIRNSLKISSSSFSNRLRRLKDKEWISSLDIIDRSLVPSSLQQQVYKVALIYE